MFLNDEMFFQKIMFLKEFQTIGFDNQNDQSSFACTYD